MTTIPRSPLGARVRQRREELGLKQHELARLLGTTRGTVSKMEVRECDTQWPFAIERLGEVLAVHPAWLRYGAHAAPDNAAQAEMAAAIARLDRDQVLAVRWRIESLVGERRHRELAALREPGKAP